MPACEASIYAGFQSFTLLFYLEFFIFFCYHQSINHIYQCYYQTGKVCPEGGGIFCFLTRPKSRTGILAFRKHWVCRPNPLKTEKTPSGLFSVFSDSLLVAMPPDPCFYSHNILRFFKKEFLYGY